jgi:lysine N6-hydroxylase
VWNGRIYDIIGIGIGPFNLGLAAMVEGMPKLDCIFFDQSPEFSWHEGMMIPGARLQVPFYADLVTLVDPCSKFTYLNWLKEKKKLLRFAIHEHPYVLRQDYNAYCQWVVEQLDYLRFGHKVIDVHYNVGDAVYTVMVHQLEADRMVFYQSRHLVVGVGTVPHVPAGVQLKDFPMVVHSSQYLHHREALVATGDVCVVGSGQSAAEVFYDLIADGKQLRGLHWYTRSERLFPMDASKLSLELSTVDYIDHFYGLKSERKKQLLRGQDDLYKGTNPGLLNAIYDSLAEMDGDGPEVGIHINCEFQGIQHLDRSVQLRFRHLDCEEEFFIECGGVVLATGYVYQLPAFLDPLKEHIDWMEDGCFTVHRNYAIDRDGRSLFVQNAELHSHGITSADLGMGPYRNAVILNSILGYECFVLERGVCFQRFGVR